MNKQVEELKSFYVVAIVKHMLRQGVMILMPNDLVDELLSYPGLALIDRREVIFHHGYFEKLIPIAEALKEVEK